MVDSPGFLPSDYGLAKTFPPHKLEAFKYGKDGGYICLLELTNKFFQFFLLGKSAKIRIHLAPVNTTCWDRRTPFPRG